MSSWSLLLVIAQSSTQILLVSLTGYVCARIGLLTPAVQKGLSQLTVKLLMPCLLFSQVAADIDVETLIRLWPIPAFLCIYTMMGFLFGFVGGKVLRLSTPQTKFAMTGIIFNNLTSLSIGLLSNMRNSEAMLILAQKEGESPSDTAARGISYALLATLVGNILRWSIGPSLLQNDKEKNNDFEEISDPEQGGTTTKISGEFTPNSKDVAMEDDDETTPLLKRHSKIDRFHESIYKIVSSIKQIMNPPLYAALVALIVGTIPPLKALFFGHDAILYPTITQTMIQLGGITIPTTLITLGAQLNHLPRSKGRGLYPIIAYVMSCRLILMPIVGIILVMSTRSFYVHDPMLWFVLILLASSPSAVNCMNIAQLADAFQEEMASLLFFSYIVVAPMLTIIVAVSLAVISKYNE